MEPLTSSQERRYWGVKVQVQNYNLSKVLWYLLRILVTQCIKIICICFEMVEKTKLIQLFFSFLGTKIVFDLVFYFQQT